MKRPYRMLLAPSLGDAATGYLAQNVPALLECPLLSSLVAHDQKALPDLALLQSEYLVRTVPVPPTLLCFAHPFFF